MIYTCPDCNGKIEISDYSTATVYVCPACGSTGNINRLSSAPQTGPQPPAPPTPPPPPGDDALEPITSASHTVPGAPAGGVPTIKEPQGKGMMADFEQDNIFDKMEKMEDLGQRGEAFPPPPQAPDYPPVPGNVTPPPPPAPVQDYDNFTEVECPICKALNQVQNEYGNEMFTCTSCGSQVSVSQEEAPESASFNSNDITGEVIGGCKVIAKIGEGGMGAVYKGMQLSLEREVAIKILPGHYSRNHSFIQRFEREAKSLAKINHQNIMGIYDFGMHGDVYYMVMELIHGKSLSDHLDDKYLFSLEEIIPIVKQAAMGLECAARNGVIHRDVKPDNIMIDGHGVVKMTDFGLAKIVGTGVSELTQEGVRVGTPSFMSPEQCRGEKNLDVRTDIYSLGVTVYFAISGELPFTGDSPFSIMLKHQNEKAKPLTQLVSELPEVVSDIVEKMMAKLPADRYQTWTEFLDALAAVERYITVNLPENTEEPLAPVDNMTTQDIDVQKNAEELPNDWSEEPQTGQTSSHEESKENEISQLVNEGDVYFSQEQYDRAVDTWQKALFLDPNNVKIQDKISEARGRVRQKKIESMLEEANQLERRRKYNAALSKLDEILKLKLSWQVKDMVGNSINRVQKKIRGRKMVFRVFRLILLFISLSAFVLVCYPSYIWFMSRHYFQQAVVMEREAGEWLGKDFEKYKAQMNETGLAYRQVANYRVPQEGVLGLLFKYIPFENKYLEKASDKVDAISLIIKEEEVKYVIKESESKIIKLEKDGKYLEAEKEFDRIFQTFSKESEEFKMVADLYKRIHLKASQAKQLYEKAVENDVFEKEQDKDIQVFSDYAKINEACLYYTRLKEEFGNTELALNAKDVFTISSRPDGAAVSIITNTGKEIKIRGKVTPLSIPLHKPNKQFTVVLRKDGYRKLKKVFRENTIDRLSEVFPLQVGQSWELKAGDTASLKSRGVFRGGNEVIILTGDRLIGIDPDTGFKKWDDENYLAATTPLVSKAFNSERDLVISGNSVIVTGLNGTFTVIKTSPRKPGEWLQNVIDVKPAVTPTSPLVYSPSLHPGVTGLFFGGGEERSFVGAVSMETGESLWETVTPEGKEKVKGVYVQGQCLQTPVLYQNDILAVTDAGIVFHIDANTGVIEKKITLSDYPVSVITQHEGFLYYIGHKEGTQVSMVYKINLADSQEVWNREIRGIVNSPPIVAEGKLVFGVDSQGKGEIIALLLNDGKIDWVYPEKGSIDSVTVGITFKNGKLFIASGTSIIVLDSKGRKLFDKYTTQLGKISAPVMLGSKYIVTLTGNGFIYGFYLFPDIAP